MAGGLVTACATFGPTLGAYATARNIAANCLFLIPDDVSDEVAAAGILKGCTTEFLVERCAKVQPTWDVLVHAAAGGVGLMLVQWLETYRRACHRYGQYRRKSRIGA